MIPIDTFEAQGMTGKYLPVVPNGNDIKLTYSNRGDYVSKAMKFRLHELDKQVQWYFLVAMVSINSMLFKGDCHS